MRWIGRCGVRRWRRWLPLYVVEFAVADSFSEGFPFFGREGEDVVGILAVSHLNFIVSGGCCEGRAGFDASGGATAGGASPSGHDGYLSDFDAVVVAAI
jgi:hypothetical protein